MQVGSLLVSQETYIELKATPEERRSLKEFLQVRIYEILEKYQHEIEGLRRENDELVEIRLSLEHKSDKDAREVEAIKKLMRDREEDYRRRTDAAERRSKELELDLKKLNSQYAILHDKGANYQQTDMNLRDLEVEHRSLQARSKLLED